MFGRKHLAGNPARGQGKEIVVPVLNALDFGQILARVLLSDDLCASGMQPFVAGGMIEVPVRIDQVRDGSAPRSARALVIWGRDAPMPPSMSTLPSGPVRTAMLPPEPSRTLILSRSLWVVICD